MCMGCSKSSKIMAKSSSINKKQAPNTNYAVRKSAAALSNPFGKPKITFSGRK